jgi:hypothetical protein
LTHPGGTSGATSTKTRSTVTHEERRGPCPPGRRGPDNRSMDELEATMLRAEVRGLRRLLERHQWSGLTRLGLQDAAQSAPVVSEAAIAPAAPSPLRSLSVATPEDSPRTSGPVAKARSRLIPNSDYLTRSATARARESHARQIVKYPFARATRGHYVLGKGSSQRSSRRSNSSEKPGSLGPLCLLLPNWTRRA